MNRSRGNASPKAKMEERRDRVIEGMKDGKTQTEIAEELKISRSTLWRDLATLRERFSEDNSEAFIEYKKAQLQVLELIEKGLLEGTINTKVADSWRAIRSDISKLLGLDAPTRTITARVDAESSPLFLRFKQSAAGLTEQQLDEVMRYAQGLSRAGTERPGPEWMPRTQKVIEGEQ
jgi:hypothetical protein